MIMSFARGWIFFERLQDAWIIFLFVKNMPPMQDQRSNLKNIFCTRNEFCKRISWSSCHLIRGSIFIWWLQHELIFFCSWINWNMILTHCRLIWRHFIWSNFTANPKHSINSLIPHKLKWLYFLDGKIFGKWKIW